MYVIYSTAMVKLMFYEINFIKQI